MTIKHINILFKGMVDKITIIGRWGTLVCHAKDHEWDMGDILDVPVSRYTFIKTGDFIVNPDGSETQTYTQELKVYLDDSELNLPFYKKIQTMEKENMLNNLAAQTAE